MLVVSNGAYKSGSTWLYRIAKEIADAEPIPDYFRNRAWANVSIDPQKLGHLLAEIDLLESQVLICKHHFDRSAQRTLLLSSSHVLILNITRDLRDVVVSAYYHEMTNSSSSWDTFADYYWDRGRNVAKSVRDYHRLWEPHPQVFTLKYEWLLEDFGREVSALGDFLGVGVSREKIEHVRYATDFGRLQKIESRSRDVGWFHRKGVSGDWRTHFDTEALSDVQKLLDGI